MSNGNDGLGDEIRAAVDTIRKVANDLEQALALQERTATVFSQRDPQWADLRLGTGTSTIGQDGCLVTCAASILADAGLSECTPAWLNEWLSLNKGFVSGNLFVFKSIEYSGRVHFDGLVNCPNPGDVPIARIASVLESGGFVIAKVDFRPGGSVEQHWIRVLSIDAENADVMDPWVGQVTRLCPKYGSTPSIALWACAFYTLAR